MTHVPYILTSNAVTVSIDGIPYTIPHTAPNFQLVIDALPADADTLRPLLDTRSVVNSYTNGRVTVTRDGDVLFDGQRLANQLTHRIVDFVRSGNERLAEPLIRFLEKLRDVPSFRVRQGLADWVAASNLPITPEGNIIAYKIVRGDFLDLHSSTFDNSPGKLVSVERNEVDEDPDKTCSHGLHVCSTEYLPHYHAGDESNRVVSVVVEPRNFVAVPRDYNCSKARVCEYKVIAEIPREQAAKFFPEKELVHWGEGYGYEYEPEPQIETREVTGIDYYAFDDFPYKYDLDPQNQDPDNSFQLTETLKEKLSEVPLGKLSDYRIAPNADGVTIGGVFISIDEMLAAS